MRVLFGVALSATCLVISGCSAQGSSSGGKGVTATGKTLTIYLSTPAGAAADQRLTDAIDAEQLAFSQLSGTAQGHFKLRLRQITATKLSDNGRTAVNDTSAIAYLGELTPGASEETAGIANGEDLLQVSPTDTALELTQKTTAVPSSPKFFYGSLGTYGKTFARVVPSSAAEAKAQVREMRALGVRSLYVGADGSPYGKAIAQAVKQDAAAAGVPPATSRAGAGAFFYGSNSSSAAAGAFAAAAKANPSAKLFAPSALATTAFTGALHPAPANLYVSVPGFESSKLNGAGQRFSAAFKSRYGHPPATQAIFGYEAMSAVLGAIQQAGPRAKSRQTVVRDFFSLHNHASVLGSYSIDAAGDTSIAPFVFDRVKSGNLVPVASVAG